MPSNARVFLKPFIGGLNTEGSDTDDLVLNTSDELNCTILPEGMRGRRYGMNIERDGRWIDSGETIGSHSLYLWNNVYGDTNFVVVQVNENIVIYPDKKPISAQTPLYTYRVPKLYNNITMEPLTMTSVTHSLFVVGPWCHPFVISYNTDDNSFMILENNPKFRDTMGIDDGLEIDEMPVEMDNRHLYNLKNQGWDAVIYDPESQKSRHLLPVGSDKGIFYDEYEKVSGFGRYPSNSLQWFVGKEKSGEYNTTDLLNTYFGNTSAPKGHYILNYRDRSRTVASGIMLNKTTSSPSIPDTNPQLMQVTTWYPAPNAEELEAFWLWDWLRTGEEKYLNFSADDGKDLSNNIKLLGTATGVLQQMEVSIRESLGSDAEFYNKWALERIDQYSRDDIRAKEGYVLSRPFYLIVYGIKNGKTKELYRKTHEFKGDWCSTNYYILDFNEYREEFDSYSFEIYMINTPKKYNIPYSLTFSFKFTKLNQDPDSAENYEGLPSTNILNGQITSVETFGGRIFYLCGSTILFSQTLGADNGNFDKCYQDADPTSEEISDPIMTDGGLIQMLSLGKGKCLKKFYRGVVAFGDKEVAGVLSPYNNLFTATEYDVVKITNAGLAGEFSVVETDNNLYYWSHHGIYELGINENNAVYARNISNESIMEFYNSIPSYSKDNCTGFYDYALNRIYWFYPTNLNALDKFDKCLVLDLNYGCFMPQEIDAGYIVRDINYNFVGRLNNSKNKINYDDERSEEVSVEDNLVYDANKTLVGFTQNKYLTDCTESITVNDIRPTMYLRAGGNKVTASGYNVIVDSKEDVKYNRKTAGLFLISDGNSYSFGDFNDREFRDWDVSPYESYMVSRPITLGDTYFNKQTPVMQTLFKRTEEYKLNNPVTNKDTIYSLNSEWTEEIGNTLVKRCYLLDNPGKLKSATLTLNIPTNGTDSSKVYTIRVWAYGYPTGDGSNLIEISTFKGTLSELNRSFDFECKFPDKEVNGLSLVVGIDEGLGFTDCSARWRIVYERTDLSVGRFLGYGDEETIEGVAYFPVNSVRPGTDGYVLERRFELPLSGLDLITQCSLQFKPIPETEQISDSTIGGIKITQASNIDEGPYLFGNSVSPVTENTTVGEKLYPYYVSGNTYVMCLTGSTSAKKGLISARWPYWTGVNVAYTLKVRRPKWMEINTNTNPAEYTTPSGAKIRMRWGWSCNPLSNRWDMVQNGYRPQKDFLHDDYVESRLHIHGRGKAFQIEIRNDDNKDFRLTGMNIITRSPQ